MRAMSAVFREYLGELSKSAGPNWQWRREGRVGCKLYTNVQYSAIGNGDATGDAERSSIALVTPG